MSATDTMHAAGTTTQKQQLKDAVREVLEEMIADELDALRAEFGLTEANREAIREADEAIRAANEVARKAEAFLDSPDRTKV